MKILKTLVVGGIILALTGGCILLGVTIYRICEAFQKSLEHGFEVTGVTLLFVGSVLAAISYLVMHAEDDEDAKDDK